MFIFISTVFFYIQPSKNAHVCTNKQKCARLHPNCAF